MTNTDTKPGETTPDGMAPSGDSTIDQAGDETGASEGVASGDDAARRDRLAGQEVVVIEATRGWASLKLGGVWNYRGLMWFLVMRDIKVRYKQSVLGALWAVINPVFTMVIFTIFFGRMAKVSSDGLPYPIFSFAALVPWVFFASGMARSTKSLVGNKGLIKKVYFPRLVIPTAAVMAGIIDFCIAFVVLIIMMLVYGIYPSWPVLLLPFLLLLALCTSLGVGLWLSALNVQFRDIGFALPLLTQVLLFVTPIAYPSSLIENETLRSLMFLNPMAGVVEGFRWSLLGVQQESLVGFGISVLVSLAILISGLFVFRRMERVFADVA